MEEASKQLKIGVIREGKVPPDKRVPLTPKQAKEVMECWPNVEVLVQPSPIRKYPDDAYRAEGIRLEEDLSECSILLGVKEVPTDMLIPERTYLFFSHTYKMQPYNAKLLKAILEKKVRLIDYEMIKEPGGRRLIGFGRYAGVVGCYNAFRLFGERSGSYSLKPAHQCHNRKEMEAELAKVVLPRDYKVVLTGFGRVGHGAREIMKLLPIKEVSPESFLEDKHDDAVFAHLEVEHYNRRKSDGGFDKAEFYQNPEAYESNFFRFGAKADLYIACHYYAEGAPYLFTREDAKHPDWRVRAVADISCDIDGPVASTIRPSTVADPFYGYDPQSESETDFRAPEAIAVMAVDNLPCELPYDASEDFGGELIKHVLPLLIEGDRDNILLRATETTLEGTLTEKYSYLADYAAKG